MVRRRVMPERCPSSGLREPLLAWLGRSDVNPATVVILRASRVWARVTRVSVREGGGDNGGADDLLPIALPLIISNAGRRRLKPSG